ncbi:hypothetical protein ACWEVP_07945 [Amycolatopsis sp. NPDC003865]
MIAARFARLSAVCALLLGASFAGAAPASATGTAGSCPEGGGVTVVVDFGDLGPQPLVRCAPGAPATGLAALQGAGFDVAGSQKYGLAIACRINGLPGPDVESCTGMPSATAYWSYWHAWAGGAWQSSSEGAKTAKPVPNGFEGWSFARTQSVNEQPPPPRVAAAWQPDAPAPAPVEQGSSFPWGLVIGAVVIVVVAGAGIVVARRRRAQ